MVRVFYFLNHNGVHIGVKPNFDIISKVSVTLKIRVPEYFSPSNLIRSLPSQCASSKHTVLDWIVELVEEHQVEIETIKADYEEQQADFKVGLHTLLRVLLYLLIVLLVNEGRKICL